MEEEKLNESDHWLAAYKKSFGKHGPEKSLGPVLIHRKGWSDCLDWKKENDGWFGPEVKPEDETDLAIYNKNIPGPFYGTYSEGKVHDSSCVLSILWKNVICWKPLDPGPMPERFNPLATTEKDDKNEA